MVRCARTLPHAVLAAGRRLARVLPAALVVALVLEMPVDDFVSLLRMSDRERRRRLALPEACVPALTAARATRGLVMVVVTCAEPDDEDDFAGATTGWNPSR